MSLILPRLYLGDIELAESIETLKHINVTHILCATCTIADKYPEVKWIQSSAYWNLILGLQIYGSQSLGHGSSESYSSFQWGNWIY